MGKPEINVNDLSKELGVTRQTRKNGKKLLKKA